MSINQLISGKSKLEMKKQNIPTCNIMGVNIAAINMKWLLDYLYRNINDKNSNKLAGNYICVSNVHTTVTAYDDPQYCEIQNSSLMSIPDGGPLSTIGRKRGYKYIARTTGPNLMEELFKESKKNQYKHYFYGSTDETLEKMIFKLKKAYPNIQIVGKYSPPFRELTTEENSNILKEINNLKPDFIWVGLGAPKQEKWMFENKGKLNGLMVGVGAAFDYFAGNIKRAPAWMQKSNIEWLYRLIQEPQRLFKRYMYTNTKFIWHVIIRGK